MTGPRLQLAIAVCLPSCIPHHSFVGWFGGINLELRDGVARWMAFLHDACDFLCTSSGVSGSLVLYLFSYTRDLEEGTVGRGYVTCYR